MKIATRNQERWPQALLEVTALYLNTPTGRPLFHNLNLSMGREQVAIIGRNGAGKTSLLNVLAGNLTPTSGTVSCNTKPLMVSQNMTETDWQAMLKRVPAREKQQLALELATIGHPNLATLGAIPEFSLGERRKLCLLAAKCTQPELLMLDEPTQDLDAASNTWLLSWLENWVGGLLVVSHDRRLLQLFRNFFLVAEAGCQYFTGSLAQLEEMLRCQENANQQRYVRRLNALLQSEEHSEQFRKRRERKQNMGRIRELGRMTPRSRLNQKRSYAQENQGRITKIRQERITCVRSWAKAARQALSIALPLDAFVPTLPPEDGRDLVQLKMVTAKANDRCLFKNLDLHIRRDRIAVLGPNGAGKTTLLRIMLGELLPTTGDARTLRSKIGAIAQGGTDWMSEESLIEHLARVAAPASSANKLVAHRFPLALAERPLASLSPGERIRAALICLFHRQPPVELLILDEPTYALDFVGYAALQATLNAWPGGLVIASHDHDFLNNIRLTSAVVLNGHGSGTI